MDPLGMGPQQAMQPIIGGQPGSGLAYPVPLSGLMMGPQGAGMGEMPPSGTQAGAPPQESATDSIDPLLLQALLAQLQGQGGLEGLGVSPFGGGGQSLLSPIGGGSLGQYPPQYPGLIAGNMGQQQQQSGLATGTGFGGDNTLKALGAISQISRLASPFAGQQEEAQQGQQQGTLSDQLRSAATPVTGPGTEDLASAASGLGGLGSQLGSVAPAGFGGQNAAGGTVGQQFQPNVWADPNAPTYNISLTQFSPGTPRTAIQQDQIENLMTLGYSDPEARQIMQGLLGYYGSPQQFFQGVPLSGEPADKTSSPSISGGQEGLGGSQSGLSLSGGIGALGGGVGLSQGILGLLRAIQSGDPAAEARSSLGVLGQATGLANTANTLSGGAAGNVGGSLGGISGGLGTAASLAGLAQDIGAGNYPGVTKDALNLLKSLYGIYSGVNAATNAAEGAAGAAGGLGAEAAGAGTGSALGGALGSALGTYGGVSAVYDLGKLGFQLGLGGGEGPSSGNPYMDAVMGLLGPVGDIIGGFSRGAFVPSESWLTFPQRLQETLGMENRDLNNLFKALGNVQSRGDITQAAQLFANDVGTRVGGYGLTTDQSGAPQLGSLPGATGGRHEGGQTVDFGPRVDALNQIMAALYGVAPQGMTTPLSQDAFNWGATQSQWDVVNSLTQQMNAGVSPDLSALPPYLQDVVRVNNDWYRRNQTPQVTESQGL